MGSARSPEPREDLPLIVDDARLRARLEAHARATFEVPGHRRAAVLVPLVERDGVTKVVLTLRSAALRAHSGQWSFPGGTHDAADGSLEATAAREADEEIGVAPDTVVVLGRLSDVPTPTGFTITPVVARVAPAPALYRPNPTEVAEVLEAALGGIGAPQVTGEVERWGRRIRIIAYQVDGRNVWGATARILEELLEVVRG